MRGRPCEICKAPDKLKIANRMIADGATDVEIVARLGVGRMSIHRHRNRHVLEPAAALARVAAKGKDVAEQRKATLEAAERGDDVATWLGLDAITHDVRKTAKRLNRAAKATESAGQYTAMTGVVAQTHKNLELRGRLGGHLLPQKSTPGEGGSLPQFNLIINMPNGVTERISAGIEEPGAPLIDQIPADEAPAPVETAAVLGPGGWGISSAAVCSCRRPDISGADL
jgi:hypothetical protein